MRWRDSRYFPGFRKREAIRCNEAAIAAEMRGEYERAEALIRYALTLHPSLWVLWKNLGNMAASQGKHGQAFTYFQHAHRLAPMRPEPLVSIAHTRLMTGDYREGWAVYEERWRDEAFKTVTASGIVETEKDALAKKWDGIPRPGKRLLVFNEQGGGDVIMMLRYRELLQHTGMEILWQVPAGFLRLLEYHKPSFGAVYTNMESTPEHDYHAPMMSLPFLFGSEKHTLPKAPYLNQSGVDNSTLSLPGLRVGICWRGQPGHRADKIRSAGLDVVRPLFDIPGISWLNLTFGKEAEREIGAWQPDNLYLPRSFDYYDSACIVRACDLVITVDSSVLHLAGAMGIPTLGMIPRPSEWRWGLECSAKHWYPSVDLIKQRNYHDWSNVIEEIHQRLTQLVQKREAA